MSLRVFASTQIAMFKNKFSLYTRDAVVTRPVTPGPKKLPQFLVCRYSAHASCPLLYILVELMSLDECNCLGASLPFFLGWFHRPIGGAVLSFLSRCVTCPLGVETVLYTPLLDPTKASRRGLPVRSRCFQTRRATQVYIGELRQIDTHEQPSAAWSLCCQQQQVQQEAP